MPRQFHLISSNWTVDKSARESNQGQLPAPPLKKGLGQMHKEGRPRKGFNWNRDREEGKTVLTRFWCLILRHPDKITIYPTNVIDCFCNSSPPYPIQSFFFLNSYLFHKSCFLLLQNSFSFLSLPPFRRCWWSPSKIDQLLYDIISTQFSIGLKKKIRPLRLTLSCSKKIKK